MSCAVGIYDKLGMTSPGNGTWKYIGYSTISSGPFTVTPVNGLFPFIALNTLLTGWGHNFVLDDSGKTAGFYKLEYHHNQGVDTVVVELLQSNPCAGTVLSQSVAFGSSTPLNFNTLAGNIGCTVSGGIWVAVTSGSGFNVNTGVLTPTGLAAGTYNYKYVAGTYTGTGCADCKTVIEFNVTVQSAILFNATSIVSDASCTYTYHVYDPTGVTENRILFTNAVDSTKYQLQYNVVVKNCDGVVVNNQPISINSTGQVATEVFSSAFTTGGHFETLRLRSTLGLNIDIPLAPGTATFTGVGGITNATELTYNSSTPAIFYNALEVAVKNYLGVLGYVSGVDYQLDRVGQYSGNSVSFRFGCKHNPTGRWLGLATTLARTTFRQTAGGSIQTTVNALVYYGSIVFNHSFSGIPCLSGLNALSLAVTSLSLHVGVIDYNTLPLLNGGAVTVSPTGVRSKLCSNKLITATPFGCAGSVTYLWSTGETTYSILVPAAPGTAYSVIVSCSSPASSVTLNPVI